MITKENKNRIRWTDTYAEQYLHFPPVNANTVPSADPRLLSTGSSGSHLSFSSAATSASTSAFSQLSASTSSDDFSLSWAPRSAQDKEAEAVSELAGREQHGVRLLVGWGEWGGQSG